MIIESVQGNKRIAINTIIIYIRMILGALISFITIRYVLAALGVSDFGLYNVVGGIVSMLNFVSIGMITTTQRFVNVEKGKTEGGNINRVFNVCLVLHLGFAIFIYFLAITIGLWYINNLLNVSASQISDARFVYLISTTVSALGILNVPFQALMVAYERFRQIAIIDIITSALRIPLVVMLLLYTGNALRFYAIGMCLITLISLFSYSAYCYYYYPAIVKWNFYREKNIYKEILIFNNYTAMGAFAYIARAQGSTMVVNYFFGTIVNGAYAIASQIECQIQSFVGNLTTAANPQMTQSYSAGNFDRSFNIVCKISRYSAMTMMILTFSIYIALATLLEIWLKDIPSGAVEFCEAMLLSLFIRSLCSGIDSLIQATGKVKWYQIIQSTMLVGGLPFSALLFYLGCSPVFIIYAFIICDIIRTIAMFVIICRITPFNFKQYAISTYLPIFKIVVVMFVYYLFYQSLSLTTLVSQLEGFISTLIFSTLTCIFLGMTQHERNQTIGKIREKIISK